MKRTLVVTIGTVFLLSGFAASVASAGQPVARQVRQSARIDQGVHNGTLRPREARHLATEQRKINKTRRRMIGDDGKLGPVERARLANMQDRASRHIFRAKHNARLR
ncbi:MAG: hypothetical protein GY733_09875 [bacterium]|nr:hypothetical protein [bacterium]